MPRKLLSIILCTRERAESLRETLRAIGLVELPPDLAAEVLVVDNGSRDRTRPVVRQATCWGRAPRYLYEPRQGEVWARNAGMAAAQGEVLLWIDDDVRPGRSWIEAMCRPIFDGRADAVAGRIRLPDHLERPWLRPWHRVCLAVDGPMTGDFDLTGANMAFARRVLEKVPAFDLELGLGTPLGAGADTLFSRQLAAAGFRLAAAGDDSAVAHHVAEDRLTRRALAEVLMQHGRSQAYIAYHWRHRRAWFSPLRGGRSLWGLCGLRSLRRLAGMDGDSEAVIGRREARWLWRWAYYRQMAIEARRERQYERMGLEKPVASYPFPTLAAVRGGGARRAA